SRAVLETAKALDFRPDIIHAQDWQTGLIPAYLKTVYRIDAFFIPTATVFTIHNIAYQGLFPKNTLFHAGFSWADFTPDGLEFYDQMNFLKAGLAYATILNTVSPAYAQEVQTTNAYGRGMEGLLQKRTKDFFGILNGIDLKEWNPAKDPLIPHPFTAKRLEPRALDKAELQRISRLTEDPRAPILGMVSRLDPQKGFDILLDIVEEFLRDGVQISVLGQGERSYLATLRLLARKYPHQASVSSNFNEPLAHKIYAGCDIFLMPSRFEPCGLGQMIALRYGAVPVVTPTGGLKDTVTPFDPQARKGLGFVSTEIGTPAYRQALLNAVRLYRWAPDVWKKLMGRGMACSFGWEQSVEKYLEIYRLALSRKQHSSPD
ncbi:MAG: glycogen synthase, partial [Elusimicrobia bacterium]|nr:glycogen synthase [Elusimicrobiota bacterium]